MCLQLIAREALSRRVKADTDFIFGRAGAPDDAAFGYRHGWVTVEGYSWNHDAAFPEIRFPRFPADQGLSD